MEAAQEFLDRVAVALQHPADDPYVTTIVVLIIISAAVIVALALIATALPSRRDSSAEDSAE